MGKRKKSSRKPQGPKKQEPLSTSFPCLFCNHEKAISVKMDKKAGTGELSCKVCGQQYQTGINYLSHAVDVYSDWVDACDSVAKEAAGSARDIAPRSHGDPGRGFEESVNPGISNDRHYVEAVDDDEVGLGDHGD